MDLIDWLHRVLGIREGLCLGGRMDLAPQTQKGDQGVVRVVAVVDDPRSFGYVAGIAFHGFPPARLADAAQDEGAALPVGRRTNAELVPGKPAQPLPAPGFAQGLPPREVGFVDPDVAGENDALLNAVDDEEDLRKPVKARGIGVSVVERGGPDRMELEQVDEELHPFRERYLPGIEYRPGERIEFSPARSAFADEEAGPLREAIPPELGRPAVRARIDGLGIDEGDLLRRGLPVLRVIPFRQRRNHHRRRRVAV